MRTGFIGFGSIGQQLLHLLADFSDPGEVLVFDDGAFAAGRAGAHPFARHREDEYRDVEFYVGLGYLHLARKREIITWLEAAGRRVPALIHPRAWVARGAEIAAGAAVYPGCIVDRGCRIGAGTLLNNGVICSHETVIGDASFLAPGVTLCGRLTVGEEVFIGASSVVANGVRIGHGARIGLGTAVGRDVPDGRSAVGNPMRLLDHPLRLT